MLVRFIFIYAFVWFFVSSVCAQQFTMQGNATQTGAYTYTITPELLNQAGMVTNTYPLDLTKNFTIKFELNFGTLDADGADGFAFLLSNICSPQLNVGSGLGVSGIANSLVVEFDTWNNGDLFNDNANDHTGIYADGLLSAAGNIMDGGPVPACLLSSCGNVEDGQWHTVEIQWEYLNVSSQKITVLFDGVSRAVSTRNHIVERFQNKNYVFWSLAGSTGAYKNLQQFRVQSQDNNNINACIGKIFTLQAPALDSNYSWTGGSSSITNTATFTAVNNGIITCTYTDYCGVNRSVNFTITVNANPVVTVNSITTCELKPAVITAIPNVPATYHYNWVVPAGVTNPGNVASFLTAKSGTYSVVITNTATGCSSNNASGIVNIIPAMQSLFTPVGDICKDAALAPLPTTSLNGITGTWNPQINNQATTTYTFTPDDNFCAFPATMRIRVNNVPVLNLGGNRPICKLQSILLDPSATGFDLNYLWQDGSTANNFTAVSAGTYTVTVSNMCGSATAKVVLTETICKVYIPSAFTPNNDGRNDRFLILGAQYVKDFNMQVYNRWGKLIYETTNPFEGWDGNILGLQQPGGWYVYRIRFTNTQTGLVENRNGSMMLIR